MNQNLKIGDKIGYWTIIDNHPSLEMGKKKKYKFKAFLCKCDCGTIRPVTQTALKTNHSKSCGCNGAYLSTGEKYSEWTVIEKDSYTNAHGNQFYICECSCGVKRSIRMSDLINGSSKNCGHNRYVESQGAKNIKNILIKNNFSFIQEYTFQDLPNRRYDFAIYEGSPNNIIRLIEFDGEQHNINSRSSWHTESLVKRDIEKNIYANKNKIPLVRIPHYKIDATLEDILGDKFLI